MNFDLSSMIKIATSSEIPLEYIVVLSAPFNRRSVISRVKHDVRFTKTCGHCEFMCESNNFHLIFMHDPCSLARQFRRVGVGEQGEHFYQKFETRSLTALANSGRSYHSHLDFAQRTLLPSDASDRI